MKHKRHVAFERTVYSKMTVVKDIVILPRTTLPVFTRFCENGGPPGTSSKEHAREKFRCVCTGEKIFSFFPHFLFMILRYGNDNGEGVWA